MALYSTTHKLVKQKLWKAPFRTFRIDVSMYRIIWKILYNILKKTKEGRKLSLIIDFIFFYFVFLFINI